MKYLIVALMWTGYGLIHSLLISLQFSKWATKVMGRYLQQVLLIGSGIVIVWAFLSYDFLEFIGIRQILVFRGKEDFTHPKTITKKGLQGIVRHPSYLATMTFRCPENAGAEALQ